MRFWSWAIVVSFNPSSCWCFLAKPAVGTCKEVTLTKIKGFFRYFLNDQANKWLTIQAINYQKTLQVDGKYLFLAHACMQDTRSDIGNVVSRIVLAYSSMWAISRSKERQETNQWDITPFGQVWGKRRLKIAKVSVAHLILLVAFLQNCCLWAYERITSRGCGTKDHSGHTKNHKPDLPSDIRWWC